MRTLIIATSLLSTVTLASAQTSATEQADTPKVQDSLRTGTERTPPEEPGPMQPQGRSGPLETTTGGAPAESPQGESPPGMQAAPEGSSKIVVEPDK